MGIKRDLLLTVAITGLLAGGAEAGPSAGDGTDTFGAYDPATRRFYFRNELTAGPAANPAGTPFGASGWTPLVGDWDGTGP